MRGRFPVLPLLELTADAGNDLPTASKHKLKNKTLKKDRENKREENQENIFSVCELPVHACAHGEYYQQSTSKQNFKKWNKSQPFLQLANTLQHTHRVLDRPVRESDGVTQMLEVVDVAEQLILQLGVVDHRDGAVLVQRPCVALQAGWKVRQVRRDPFNHHAPERSSSLLHTIMMIMGTEST